VRSSERWDYQGVLPHRRIKTIGPYGSTLSGAWGGTSATMWDFAKNGFGDKWDDSVKPDWHLKKINIVNVDGHVESHNYLSQSLESVLLGNP